MGYVTVRGGEEAIREAEALFRELFPFPGRGFLRGLEAHLPFLLDRVMGEAGFYAPSLAAEALAQSAGDLYEAVLLLRAYRTTLPRLEDALPQGKEDLLLLRRLSSAFKGIPGGQVLGPTLDYSLRLLGRRGRRRTEPDGEAAPRRYPSVASWLSRRGLLAPEPGEPPSSRIPDLTREPLRFPAPRAHRLQALARGDTGGLLALAYSGMRAYNAHSHPTVAELGVGFLEVRVLHPLRGGPVVLGRVRVAFAEVVLHGEGGYRLGFAAGLGWNEVRVIAGAMLDLEMDRPTHPAREEEFVLVHTDPVEASGFALHYKLPHYVTFLSNLVSSQEVEHALEEV
ncbi:carbon-phosphorus lyase (plasmid) [Thermus thermophilus]|uniref:carbon-phosphorus lyase complex subunit PhnI n=1 Tax=Thermus thermophilus TaxID=274 RepID=UPI001FCB96EA|nr:carbon-phosphorus lyase complex subunit PhnI [Thermus thermophilus]BDG20180.1 carbon-phosphorus lyase [Thermus thermophilus]BDG22734.1 carbon-phosphorus lyase [Thermus thermophilus]BDG29802.1 carbon-phosphorus lyase [Thermus thermophilus]